MIVVITGGIGTGKSAVAKYLAGRAKGEYCDADQYCAKLLEKDAAGYRGLVGKWGGRFLLSDGNVNRPLLRQTIFRDDAIRVALENILHPLVREHILKRSQPFLKSDKILVIEIPLLFETGWHSDFDIVVVVYARREECIRRVVERDNVTAADVLLAMDAQLPLEEKIRLTPFVVDNSYSWESTCASVDQLLIDLMKNTGIT